MKYFIDTEFVEGPQREKFPISLFRKETPNTIDLISIGIVAEDGREYYAISKDFNLKEAWNRFDIKTITLGSGKVVPDKKVYWLREKVLKPIYIELHHKEWNDAVKARRFGIAVNMPQHEFTYKNLKRLINRYGKTNKDIAKEVEWFCNIGTAYSTMDKSIASVMHFTTLDSEVKKTIEEKGLKFVFNEVPEFYAYYADYDWVVFCWLFGKMIDLPSGFPMFCKDLKQMLDEKIDKINSGILEPGAPLVTARSMKKNNPNFPIQDSSKSHNAIEDARWNKQLFEFLTQL
jgi:hypothetical protein